jgi:hypothetical protein
LMRPTVAEGLRVSKLELACGRRPGDGGLEPGKMNSVMAVNRILLSEGRCFQDNNDFFRYEQVEENCC